MRNIAFALNIILDSADNYQKANKLLEVITRYIPKLVLPTQANLSE